MKARRCCLEKLVFQEPLMGADAPARDPPAPGELEYSLTSNNHF
ncbi:hypothetical protein MOTE_18370 [Moorella thermoacetica]|uniref:Uncharacterized protein n=1 Tax=Neomoorella thermoacetica TaxID=1525 RepID=A0A1J5NHX8_NEOTH|nr:hypothetical protein MOTE_18370 [Moorella thermoacetica]